MTTAEFTRKCRELQGKFRERMGEPMGKGPFRKSPNYQINMLVNGEETGKNFVNESSLFNNMLSSQPMAFNLFCPFMQMLEEGKVEAVTNIFKAIFPDKYIGEVTKVGLEYLDTEIKNYLNDCTAMDAIVRYKDTDGKPAFIAIEKTKYTDVLGENTSGRKNVKYDYWIEKIGMFKPDTEAELIRSAKAAKTAENRKELKKLLKGMKVVTQIYRNFLLTECYGIKEGAGRCYSVVLAPAQHPTTEKEVASLKDELKPEYQDKISAVSLEDFVERTLQVCPEEDKVPFLYFKDRYIPE